jgi:hypothetical protein
VLLAMTGGVEGYCREGNSKWIIGGEVAGGWKNNALKEARVVVSGENIARIPPGEDSTDGRRSSAQRSREEHRHKVAHMTEAVGVLPHTNLPMKGKIVCSFWNNEMDGGGGGPAGCH